MDEETLADELVNEASFAKVVASVARSRKRYAIRVVEELPMSSGDTVVATCQVRYPDVVTFASTVTLTPERVPHMFGLVEMSGDVVSAEAFVDDRWVRFHPAP
ncbi:hypothetical protein [Nocardiopsis sp. CNR-923]|uniref:hypothetical protein n=1 Tax=Nocardiopsis sp. CNR-923 TaxID=1904965 RepID=UPI00117CA07E|nr:hypothetical protein [Nocardiopsis sp. CNR-923]